MAPALGFTIGHLIYNSAEESSSSGMNCIKIGLPGKQIVSKRRGLREVLFSWIELIFREDLFLYNYLQWLSRSSWRWPRAPFSTSSSLRSSRRRRRLGRQGSSRCWPWSSGSESFCRRYSCVSFTLPTGWLWSGGRVPRFVDLNWVSSPGWWAATVAIYCPSRMVEHPKSKSTQPRYSTTRVTLYYNYKIVKLHLDEYLFRSCSWWCRLEKYNKITLCNFRSFMMFCLCFPSQKFLLQFFPCLAAQQL